jgi:hypothetical protein
MGILKHDVGRLDRLITDISNASRLDAELSRDAPAPWTSTVSWPSWRPSTPMSDGPASRA